MEKLPKSEEGPNLRIVGNAPLKAKEAALEELRGVLREKHLANLTEEARQKLAELEYPKTEKEVAAIEFADQEVSRLMVEAGVPPYSVPVRNFHIVPPDSYVKNVDPDDSSYAMTLAEYQSIVVNASEVRNNPLFFGKIAFHELNHLKGNVALKLKIAKEGGKESVEKVAFRGGLKVLAPEVRGLRDVDEHEHFRGLDEALIGILEKDFVAKLIRQPIFEAERQWLSSPEATAIKKKIAQEQNELEEDIFWVSPNGKDYQVISYGSQRRVLGFVINEIYEDFGSRYPSKEAVLKEFIKSFFTGKLLTIAHLVEETFGDGSFGTLGLMGGEEEEEAVAILERLRILRYHRKSASEKTSVEFGGQAPKNRKPRKSLSPKK